MHLRESGRSLINLDRGHISTILAAREIYRVASLSLSLLFFRFLFLTGAVRNFREIRVELRVGERGGGGRGHKGALCGVMKGHCGRANSQWGPLKSLHETPCCTVVDPERSAASRARFTFLVGRTSCAPQRETGFQGVTWRSSPIFAVAFRRVFDSAGFRAAVIRPEKRI